MSLYISKVSEGLIQHVSVKKCKEEKKTKKPSYEISHTKEYIHLQLCHFIINFRRYTSNQIY